MADPQGLFDVLAGAAGAPVDRPRLDAFVANSQAANGLRTAQTENALLTAQRSVEEAQARGGIKQHFINSGLKDSDAQLATDMITAGAGNASQVADMLKTLGQDVKPDYTLSDPSQLGTAAAAAAAQARTGKVADPFTTVPSNYIPTPGVPAPTAPVQVNPETQAKIDSDAAMAGLHHAQTGALAQGGTLDDNAAYVAAQRYNMTQTLPTLGSGAAGLADRRKVLGYAASLTADPNWVPPSWNGAPTVPHDPNAAPATAPGVTHPTATQAAGTVVAGATTKANTAALGDMTKRTAIADASEQTAAANLKLAQHYLTTADQTGSPLINSVLNKLRSGVLGDPDVSAYTNALTTAANEYARVVSMATGAQGITDAARKEGQLLFSPNLGPEQLANNIKVALKEMGNRTGSMHTQIHLIQSGIAGSGGAQSAPAAAPVNNNDPLGIRGQ